MKVHQQIILKYLILTGIFNFGASFIMGTYGKFLETRGLNLFEINLVNVAFFTSMFIFEVPTGAFADRYGRKKSYVFSCFLFAIGEIMYFFSDGMLGFCMAEITAGIGRTFANGALHAWLVDTLRHHGYTGTTQPVFRKEVLVQWAVAIPGSFVGGYIASYDIAYPWLAGACVAVVSAYINSRVMTEEYFIEKKPTSIVEAFRDMVSISRTSLRYVHEHPSMRFLIWMTFVSGFSVQAINMQWQILFSVSLGTTEYNGLIGSGLATTALTGIIVSSFILKRTKREDLALVACHVLTGVIVIGVIVAREYVFISLVCFLIHEIPRMAYGPIRSAYLHDLIDVKERATVTSCQSMYGHFACVAGLVVSGLIAHHFSIVVTWTLSGMIFIGVPLMVWVKRKGGG